MSNRLFSVCMAVLTAGLIVNTIVTLALLLAHGVVCG